MDSKTLDVILPLEDNFVRKLSEGGVYIYIYQGE